MSCSTDLPDRVEDWTKEHVRQWLISDLNIYGKNADMLYEQEVSGLELVCFQKQDLLDLKVKHGPAVRIVKEIELLKRGERSSKGQTNIKPKATQKQEIPAPPQSLLASGSRETLDASEAGTGLATVKENCPERKKPKGSDGTNAGIKSEEDAGKESAGRLKLKVPKNEHQHVKNEKSHVQKQTPAQTNTSPDYSRPCSTCSYYPFDKSASHRYTQHAVLPPETGPGNLTDPVHEYKLLGNTENAHDGDIFKKFTNEVFRFAAACMNSRTNGTIHFGVGDKPKYQHGEIVGIEVADQSKFIDNLNQGRQSYFGENLEDAKMCIRQPRFVDVLSNATLSNRCVIEVDVVPSHAVCEGKEYNINMMLCENNKWRKSKETYLFVRDGASSKNIMGNQNPKEMKIELKKFSDNIKKLDSQRKSAENIRSKFKMTSNQGEKLKQLITHGRGTLNNYDQYIFVINKSHPEQLEHLQFLSELKIFTVLEFDPDSEVDGVCRHYRQARVANLHSPADLLSNEPESARIAKLNLYKQPSWLFCNGRGDLENEADKPLNPADWLIKRAEEVQNAILFLCSPEVIEKGTYLVVFLLLSAVESMIDPVFETFFTLYKNLGGAQNIVCICESENTFTQWKSFVLTRCQIDITKWCIYELSLSEVNGTIMKLRSLNQTSSRFLPSSGSSSVILEKKDEDLMTAFTVLCENECEDTDIEKNEEEFKMFRIEIEEDFYRGGRVMWWNFYFSELPQSLPFIKREQFDTLKSNITAQAKSHTSMCVIQNLFHHPGCGGSTLAMHVLWKLRKQFRCAVLKNNTVPYTEVASQVRHLLMCGKSEQSSYTPLLILVDDLEGTENAQDLQKCIRKAIDEISIQQESPLVILLNCVRSQDPKQSYKNSVNDSIFITNLLSPKEQQFFKVKLKELQKKHDKPDTFYAFMIMKENFSEEYIEKVVSNTLKDMDTDSKQAQLVSFLALLNSYVNNSSISVSLCEEFLGIKSALRREEKLEGEMAPYSTLFIRFQVEECGTYQAVRFIHHRFAIHCLQELTKKYNVKKREIITNFLHYDLFFKTGMGKDTLMQNIHSMLITRQRRKEGDGKDTLFSPLIEEIKAEDDEGILQVTEVLMKAVDRFDKSYTIPQAIARHMYLNQKDFESALKWANIARSMKENSYTLDTIGQVFKSELRHKTELAQTTNKTLTPEDLQTYLELAQKATKVFKEAQNLAKESDVSDSEDYRFFHKKKPTSYNVSGYVGEMDVAMTVYDILSEVPFFCASDDAMSQIYMLKFLKGNMPVSSIRTTRNRANDKFAEVLSRFEGYIVNLKPQVKQVFDFFENYYVYLKDRNVEKEMESRSKHRISEHFKKYCHLFCTSDTERRSERISKPQLSLQQDIEEKRMFLERQKADRFSSLLHCIDEKSEEMMQKITETYAFINKQSSSKTVRDQTNYILANIILRCKIPKWDEKDTLYKKLSDLLHSVLQETGTQYPHPEPYYLALLLFWPGQNYKQDDNWRNICTYVASLGKSFNKQFSHMLFAKNTVAHFYLGKGSGLNRIIHKAKIEECIGPVKNLNSLWKSGALWKEKPIQDLLVRVSGTTEQGKVYIQFEDLKIPVRAAYLGGIRSGYSKEKVSFYLGFSIDGPIACGIENVCYS
ncbi:sterile alpha motif domain-containing protein 9 [Amia ocellicauda]|uniref:sterile alpha motif domain-containing protein 9 n=1 Tax=Amia ocellicauda TaxID=2972642 RepID=UPI003464C02E